jgi:Tfp pilus assembly protein PilX
VKECPELTALKRDYAVGIDALEAALARAESKLQETLQKCDEQHKEVVYLKVSDETFCIHSFISQFLTLYLTG